MNSPVNQENIEKVIQDVAEELDYIIYESSIYFKGESSKFSIKIDHPDGISHSDCEVFTKELTARLDEENVLSNYSLEVSSPGIARKLRSIEEFVRFAGAPVKIIFEVDGERAIFKGTIKNVIDTMIELKSDMDEIRIDFNNIIRANLEY